MDRLTKVLALLLLGVVLLVQSGCATSEDTTDSTPPLETTPSHEDGSHGWGATVASPN